MKPYCLSAFALIVFATLPGSVHARGPGQFNLGPTGLTGTPSKTSIKVTKVAEGSPADGKIKVNDEILGAGSALFKTDVRRELAAAINRAETREMGGRLTLILKGNRTIDVPLRVLGSYSRTAPYKCPKTNAIITNAANALVESDQVDQGVLHTGLLGLMATGEKRYIDLAAQAIQNAKWAKPDAEAIDDLLSGGRDMGYVGWYWGYNLITLGEYHLLTGDRSVLPAIKTYALGLARGQDAGGLWGHRMISPARYGRLPGYAQMNQPSLTSFMGLLFAQKCGIQDPVLDKAIHKTRRYFESYVGEGGFPYGVGGGQTGTFNNNGTSGSAAICMALLGNKEGAKFFSHLAATSYDGMETGHASTFFNPLWTPLGAAISGPKVNHLFFKNSLWLQTLYRSWDGSFCRFDRNGKEGPQAGVALLTYCLPRKALFITGREADQSLFLAGQAADDVVGLSTINYKGMTPEKLMELAMHHPIPQVRRAASGTLTSDHREALLPKWIALLKNGSSKEKELALGQYGWWIPVEKRAPQKKEMGAILRDDKETLAVRMAAAVSISYLGDQAKEYYPDIVTLLAMDRPDDTFGAIDGLLGGCLARLSQTPYTHGLVRDKNQHLKAGLKLCHHKRQNARADGLRMLADIPREDFPKIADVVMHIIKDRDPTYHSYSNPGGPVSAAITILANLQIREGIQSTLDVLDNPSGKWGFKVRMIYNTLPKYGGNAKEALRILQADERFKNIGKDGRFAGGWRAMVAAIEGDTNPPKLIGFEEAKRGK